MNSLFVLVCLVTLAFANASLDYCELNCPDIRWNHIQCGKNESFGSRCPEGTLAYDFSEDDCLWGLMLDSHNNLRDKVAGGGLTGFPKATSMSAMVWSTEHATNAYFNVKDCLYETDPCHDIEKGKKSGQNIAVYYFKADDWIPSAYELIKRAFKEWKDTCQLIDHPKEIIISLPDPEPYSYSTCLRMIKENNNKIGCSAGLTSDGYDGKMWWVVCNYEEDIEVGQITYNSVPEVASGCGNLSPDYANLCSVDQNINYPEL